MVTMTMKEVFVRGLGEGAGIALVLLAARMISDAVHGFMEGRKDGERDAEGDDGDGE